MAQLVTLGGVTVKKPHKFQISRYNITKSGRVANGDMTMEYIAKKRKFHFGYNVISGGDLDTLLGVIDTTTMFFTLTYVQNDVTKTATVYAGHIPTEQFRTDAGAWYWKDANFDLIEK